MKVLFEMLDYYVGKTFSNKGVITLPIEMKEIFNFSDFNDPIKFKVNYLDSKHKATVTYRHGQRIEQKNTKLYYAIGEVAKMFDVNTSLIRYWEKEFSIIKPKKNRKGNRLFTQKDIENFHLIFHLVKERGMTLQGAKKKLKDNKDDIDNNFEVVKRLSSIKKMLTEIKEEL